VKRNETVPISGVNFAQFTNIKPSFIETNPSSFTRAQKEGLRYEKKVFDYLKKLLVDEKDQTFEIKVSPWIMFRTNTDAFSKIRFCQPDTVLISKDFSKIIICEVKYQHTNEAWKQLRLLYEPVLRFMFPKSQIACLEICRWFDPHTHFTEHFYYAENPLSAIVEQLGVHIYRPRKKSSRD